MENIKELSKKHPLFVADVPVFGNTVFDLNFARENAEKLKKVYSFLADEQSKKVFENTVLFKITGKAEYLFQIEAQRSEVFSLLDLNENETFLDLGAYNGDTVAEFIKNTNGYNFITALEPDSRNYRKLTENTKDLSDISCINGAVSDYCGVMKISAQHGRGVSGENGVKKETQCFTIDALAQKNPPTFIKIDVEGNESVAIVGGKDTIQGLKPKMHVAVYHKSEDLFEIPLKLYELCPSYKFYLRHHPYLPAWDTNLILI
jgi:FkbM family methyltransferase